MDSDAAQPRIARWTWVLAAWTAAGLLLAAQGYFSGRLRGEPQPLGQLVGIWLGWAYAWAVLTPGALWLHARLQGRRHALPVHIVAAPLFALANLALFASIAPLIGAQNTAATWLGTFRNLLSAAFVINAPLYFLVVGIAQWRHLSRSARERATRQLALEHQLSEARLLTLRAQLQPHFLFNALNTIAVLMREDVDAAERVLFDLSTLLRSVLQASDAPLSRVADEFRLAETYLAVEKARFGDRLEYRFDTDPSASQARCPSLLLQPLVENCVRHAVSARRDPTRISVAAELRDEALYLCVRDDGPGLGPPRTGGVGLENTRARLQLLYPDRHVFSIVDHPEGGVEVRIQIPHGEADEAPRAGR